MDGFLKLGLLWARWQKLGLKNIWLSPLSVLTGPVWHDLSSFLTQVCTSLIKLWIEKLSPAALIKKPIRAQVLTKMQNKKNSPLLENFCRFPLSRWKKIVKKKPLFNFFRVVLSWSWCWVLHIWKFQTKKFMGVELRPWINFLNF